MSENQLPPAAEPLEEHIIYFTAHINIYILETANKTKWLRRLHVMVLFGFSLPGRLCRWETIVKCLINAHLHARRCKSGAVLFGSRVSRENATGKGGGVASLLIKR